MDRCAGCTTDVFRRPDALAAGRHLQPLPNPNQVGASQAVDAGERPDVGAVAASDTAQRLPAAHPVRRDRRGLAVGLRVRVERGVPGKEAVSRARRDAQFVAARHVQVATADQAAERLVESQQIIPVERGRGRQVVQRHEVRQRDLVVRQWRLAFDRPEIRLRVALDLDGRQQLGIEIPRSEAERPSVVAPNDLGDVARPQPPHRTFHPRPAVVVSGHGQRPGFQRGIIILEQSRRGPRGQQWVAAFVHDVVDGQIQPAGGRNELPHPRGARLGIRVHVERRLDERQTGQFDRQPLLTKDPFDLRQVAARYAETLTKPLAHPCLRAQTPARRGLAEFVPLVDVREHQANLPFTTAEPPPLRTVPMQIAQRSPNLLDLPLDPRRPHPARLGLRVLVVQRLEIQDRVHLVQVHGIVDDSLISGVSAEDVRPEFDLRAQRLGIGQHPERPPGCRIARRLRRTEYE